MTAPTLRGYQLRAVEGIFGAWDAGVDRVAISAATGAGKSVIFGDVARRHLHHHRGAGPVVLLAHRRELIVQAAGHFARANPDLRVETVIGSPGPARSTRRAKALSAWRRADVLVSTVQTLNSKATLAAFPDPSLVICDEAHHFSAAMFRRVLTALGCDSGTRALGVTATPFREDHRSFSDVFPVIAAAIDISWLINHCDDGNGGERQCAPGAGYLVPPSLRHLIVDGLDLSEVPTSQMSGAVDFREAELAEALEAAGAFDMVAEAVTTELAGRKGAIFAPTVASSKYLAERITAMGTPCHHVDGSMATPERDRVIGDFRDDTVRWLSNVGIISEGFDIPQIDAVVLARPTRSRIFFRQAVGRALRPAPGKTDAVVLDVAGASDGHSLAGVEALTDTEVLTAAAGESLTELLDRSDRARRGRRDRIAAHVSEARLVQERAERSVEQMKLTTEGLGSQLPGLVEFFMRAEPLYNGHEGVLDHVTAAVDRPTGSTLDELSACERFLAEEVSAASSRLSRIEALKTSMREALAALKEEPAGEVARAMATGYVGTVRGELFGEEEEREQPGAPGAVGALKLRNGQRDAKPVHPARYGWCFRTPAKRLFVPVHTKTADITALMVAVPVDNRWMPVRHDSTSGTVDELSSGPLGTEDDAYRLLVQRACDESGAVNLIDSNAAWRRKPSAPGDSARAVARRVDHRTEIPDNATKGFVSDVITYGRYVSGVDRLGDWAVQQIANTHTEPTSSVVI